MITIDIVFYLPEVLSTPCGNHLCKNHVDVHATEENMLFNRNYVRQRQLLDGCHLEINFEVLHNTLKKLRIEIQSLIVGVLKGSKCPS